MPAVKRLVSTDQFCSEAHRQSYQEETNRLALDRLLNPKSKAAAADGRGSSTITVDAVAAPAKSAQSGRASLAYSRATAHHQFEPSTPLPESVGRVASELNVSDSRLDNASQAVLPMAGLIEADLFYLLSNGGTPLRPVAEDILSFPRAISRTTLNLGSLTTTGLEDQAGYGTWTGLDWVEEPDSVPVGPAVNVAAVLGAESMAEPIVLRAAPQAPPPALIPVFQKTQAYKVAAVSSNFDFEPLGDFLEMEDEEIYAAEAPAPVAAPRPEAAAAVTGPNLDLKPAEPAPGKLQQGFAALPCEPSAIHAPALSLSPLRKKLVSGPNPNAKPAQPKPPVVQAAKPAAAIPQKPAAPQRPAAPPAAPSFTVKPATAKPTPVVKPVPVSPPAAARPAIAARDRVSPPARVESLPAAKPAPIAQTEPAPKSAAADPHEIFPTLGMGTANDGFWASASARVRIAAAGGLLAVVGLLGWYLMKSGPKVETASATSTSSASAAAAMSMGGGGWATNWGQDFSGNKGKRIQLFRPSMSYTDYHIDLRGQIEKKAMGWIFRASNPKNYYVMKLEIVKPGRTPVVALVKYAVINGKEQTHTQVMLPSDMPLTMDMEYKVRTDVSGTKFTTYVQGKLVDYWTDDAIKLGGAGIYSEKDERARVKSELITP